MNRKNQTTPRSDFSSTKRNKSTVNSSNFHSSHGLSSQLNSDTLVNSNLVSQTGGQTTTGDATMEEPASVKSIYKEKDNMNEFLLSEMGVEFLCREFKVDKRKPLLERIDDIIDFYTAWADEFPVRWKFRTNKYEFLKRVENFCFDDKGKIREQGEEIMDRLFSLDFTQNKEFKPHREDFNTSNIGVSFDHDTQAPEPLEPFTFDE